MSFLARIYEKILVLSKTSRATYYLVILSFSESSFFPIPPDVMLAPMCIAQPKRIWILAFYTTTASVLGGLLGYFIGVYGFSIVEPILMTSGYMDKYDLALQWFNRWGFWAILVAGFSPIPYKLFTIAAGVVSMALPAFILASFVGRGLRFFLLGAMIKLFGNKIDSFLKRHINVVGWASVFILLAFIGVDFFNQYG